MFLILEIQCPVIHTWEDIVVNTSAVLVGTAVEMSCSVSQVTSVNGTYISECLRSGEWAPPVIDCSSKFIGKSVF